MGLSQDNRILVVVGVTPYVKIYLNDPVDGYVLSQTLTTTNTQCQDVIINDNNTMILVGGSPGGLFEYVLNSATGLFEEHKVHHLTTASTQGHAYNNDLLVLCFWSPFGSFALF